MGLWDALRGRARVRGPDLDQLFAVPAAAVTLEIGLGLRPTGTASACFRAAEGAAFRRTQDDVVALLDADPAAPDVRESGDEFGFTWLTVTRDTVDPDQVTGLCTDLHAVNTALEAEGFGTGLLCSLVPFADDGGRRVGLVYLYRRGTFYPFAPTGPQRRDNLLELQVRDALAGELRLEPDLAQWLALWGAPGL